MLRDFVSLEDFLRLGLIGFHGGGYLYVLCVLLPSVVWGYLTSNFFLEAPTTHLPATTLALA